METISDLTTRHIAPDPRKRHEGKVELLFSPIAANKAAKPAMYEAEVFNFLLRFKGTLGVQTVMRFTNLSVDGAIDLFDGKRLVIKMKHRMNWMNACEAESEFRQFLGNTDKAKPNPVRGVIVFFEEFSGDWAKQDKSRSHVNGWDYWYEGHCKVEGHRMDLLNYSEGKLAAYPSTQSRDDFGVVHHGPKRMA